MQEGKIETAKITFRQTIDLAKIAKSGQCFRWRELSDETYGTVWGIPSAGAYTRAIQVSANEIRITDKCNTEYWKNYFDSITDQYQTAKFLAWEYTDRDPFMENVMDSGAHDVIILNQDIWEIMVSFMISQNNNIPRIKKSIEALCDRFGEHRTAITGDEYTTIPDPEKLTNLEDLQGLGLGYRDTFIATMAANVMTGKIDILRLSTMDYSHARTYLKTIKGIGDKVADCICLFALGHKESFPIDTWIKKVIDKEYAGKFPVENYIGCAGIIQQWIFYYMQQQKEARHEKK